MQEPLIIQDIFVIMKQNKFPSNLRNLLPTCFKYMAVGMTQFLTPSVDYFKSNSLMANNNRSHTNSCFILHSYFTSIFYLSHLEILQGWHLLPPSPLKSRPTVVNIQMLMKTQTVFVPIASWLHHCISNYIL